MIVQPTRSVPSNVVVKVTRYDGWPFGDKFAVFHKGSLQGPRFCNIRITLRVAGPNCKKIEFGTAFYPNGRNVGNFGVEYRVQCCLIGAKCENPEPLVWIVP